MSSATLSTSGSGTEQAFTTLDSDSNCAGVLSVQLDGTALTGPATFRIYQWAPDASYRALAWEAELDSDHKGVLSPPLLVGGAVVGLTFGIVTTDAIDWPVTVIKETNALTAYVNPMAPDAVATPSTTEVGSGTFLSGIFQSLVYFQLPLASGEEMVLRDRLADFAATNVQASRTVTDDTAAAAFYPGLVVYGEPLPCADTFSTVIDRSGGSSTRDIYRQVFQIT